MNEFEFDRLIELYQKGLLVGKDKKLVEDWLNKSGEEGDASFSENDKFRLQQKIFKRLRKTGKTIEFIPDIAIQKKPARSWSSIYKIAASLTLIAVAAYFTFQYSGSNSNETVILSTTSSSGISKVILSDGTLVWLKGKSNLSYPSTFSGNTRNVSLQGEALFEVAKDAKHPFIIACGDLKTTVLGTSFNIKSSDEKIEVVVLTGKVSLTSASDAQGIIVLPNEKVVYDGNKKKIVEKQLTVVEEKSIAVDGTQYIMAFEDSRMSDVIHRIEEKFEVRISADNVKLRNCMITADFSDQSLENTLSMISQALGFTYEIKGKTVALQGKGCD
jgi:ferric-dicitrate binding protein FerR (iron transport regulator)